MQCPPRLSRERPDSSESASYLPTYVLALYFSQLLHLAGSPPAREAAAIDRPLTRRSIVIKTRAHYSAAALHRLFDAAGLSKNQSVELKLGPFFVRVRKQQIRFLQINEAWPKLWIVLRIFPVRRLQIS
jgi:hypothetical protein